MDMETSTTSGASKAMPVCRPRDQANDQQVQPTTKKPRLSGGRKIHGAGVVVHSTMSSSSTRTSRSSRSSRKNASRRAGKRPEIRPLSPASQHQGALIHSAPGKTVTGISQRQRTGCRMARPAVGVRISASNSKTADPFVDIWHQHELPRSFRAACSLGPRGAVDPESPPPAHSERCETSQASPCPAAPKLTCRRLKVAGSKSAPPAPEAPREFERLHPSVQASIERSMKTLIQASTSWLTQRCTSGSSSAATSSAGSGAGSSDGPATP